MISPSDRKLAKQISAGQQPPESGAGKVVLYGLLARALTTESLEQLQIPASVKGFNQIQKAAFSQLSRIAIEGYQRQLPEAIDATEQILKSRRDDTTVPLLIESATMAAVNREFITLRTLRRSIIEDSVPLSRDAVYASSRVPFKLAMLHLKDVNSDRLHRESWGTSNPDTDDYGSVLKRGSITVDSINGLNFLPDLDLNTAATRQTKHDSHGPQIGCPVTLVDGYVQTLHRTLSDAVIDASLISVV